MTQIVETQIRKVLVHAANGIQGSAIARQLHGQGFEVIAGVRNMIKAEVLRAERIRVARFELDNREALRLAPWGVDAVVLTLPLEWKREIVLSWARNVAEVSRDAGVRVLVFNCGVRIPDEPSDVPVFELRREVVALLREFGPDSIILRAPMFMENLTAPWVTSAITRERLLPYPVAASVRVSWLAVTDLGAYIAAALRRPDLVGRAIDIGGPEALDGEALAAALAQVVGQPLSYLTVAPGVIAEQLSAQLGPDVAQGIARNYAWIAKRPTTALFTGTNQELLSDLRRSPLSVAQWAERLGWRA
jgi:NAD(P)H dehydrogenase (quinone)